MGTYVIVVLHPGVRVSIVALAEVALKRGEAKARWIRELESEKVKYAAISKKNFKSFCGYVGC